MSIVSEVLPSSSHCSCVPLPQWERLHMTKGEWRKILCSVVFHLLSLSCVTWSAYILFKRTAEDFRLGKEGQYCTSPTWLNQTHTCLQAQPVQFDQLSK